MNPTQYMYLGPNRPFGLPLVTRAIFRGDPEKTFPQLSALFEQHKELRTLFVPVAEPVSYTHLAGQPKSSLVADAERRRAEAARQGGNA